MTLVCHDASATWYHCGCAMLLQALLRQACATKMLRKQLSAEELQTQVLVMVIQHLTEAAERAQAEACSLRTANLDLHTELQGRDAEVSDLRRTVQELRSSLAPDVKEEVALLLIHHLLTLTLTLHTKGWHICSVPHLRVMRLAAAADGTRGLPAFLLELFACLRHSGQLLSCTRMQS